MRNFGKFISKHFFIYLSVVILIVLLDLLIFFLTFNGTVNSISKDNPIQILEKVSNNLTIPVSYTHLTLPTTSRV